MFLFLYKGLFDSLVTAEINWIPFILTKPKIVIINDWVYWKRGDMINFAWSYFASIAFDIFS